MATSLLQWLLQTDYKDKGVKDAQKDLAGLKKGAGDMITQLTGMNMTGLTAIGVVAGLGAAVKKSVDYYVEYTDAIREATNLTGMSAEETSRLVNVADDYGITTEKLTTAMEQANKKGFLPSIENLAALSDEYLATEDPLKRNQLLTDKVGRAGMDLVEIMKLGGDAIRDKAAAVEEGMIVDEEALAKGLAYKQSVDDLEDKFNALKITVGEGVVPALIWMVNGMVEGISVMQQLVGWSKKLKDVLSDHEVVVKESSDNWEDYAYEMVRAGQAAGQFHGMQARAAQALLDGKLSAEDYEKQLKLLANELGLVDQATFQAMKEQVEFNGELYDSPAALAKAREEFERLHPGLLNFAEATLEAAEANAYFKDQLGLLKDAIAGSVGKELDSYADTLKDIAEKTQEAKDKTAELIAIPVEDRTEEQKKAIDEYNESVEQLGIEAEKAAKKHHEAMAKIVYDMAAVQAQADGVITEAEYLALEEYATRMGIVDQSTLDAQYAMQVMGDELKDHPEYYENSARAMEAMTRALDDGYISADELTNIMRTLTGGTWNVSVGVNVDDSELDEVLQRIIRGATLNVGVGYNDNPIPMAEGGEGVVNRPTLFLAGEAGPEYFNFTPMKPGESKSGGSGVTINMYGSINNGMELEEFAQYVLNRIR